MSKSVLRYELVKGQYFDPETSFNQSCSPNKKADGRRELMEKLVTFIVSHVTCGNWN